MRVVFLILLILINLFAITKEEPIKALKANPSLIESPQAQKILEEKGINKEKVLEYIEGKKQSSDTNINDAQLPTQNIEIIEKKVEKKIKGKDKDRVVKKSLEVDNPFVFIDKEKLIEKIKSAQQKVKKPSLKRYGEKFFYNKNKLNTKILAAPEYYQINIKDKVLIEIFGGVDKKFELEVNNNGNINLPVVGPLHVAGLSVYEVKKLVTKKLTPTYPNSTIVVNIKVDSFIQVTLTGFVKAPGIYNLASLSTIKDLLIAADGFGDIGSMREVILKRDGKVLKIVDFYKLIKDGDIVDTTLLKNGDIIYVPKAKNLVKLYGDVYKSAIYELKDKESIKDLLNYSGGLKPSASSEEIRVERFLENKKRKVYKADINSKFVLKDGDEVYVYKVSELNKDLVYVYGNIEKPGVKELPKTRLLKDLLKNLKFLKDTYYEYGVLERDDGEFVSFNIKNPLDLILFPKDKIYIFNKYDILPQEYILIEGDVVETPGKYRFLNGMKLEDVVNGIGLKENYNKHKIQLIRYDKEFRPHLKFLDLDKDRDFRLKPFDEITFFDYYNFNPLKPVTILGEVNKPDTYIFSKGMNLKDAVLMAGWFTDRADKNYIELIRYRVENGKREREIFRLTQKDMDFALLPYDEINVKRIPKWYDRKTVEIIGEVKYPGVYTISNNETLYDVLKRAGGFSDDAYLYGAVFTRESVKLLRQKEINNMLYRLKKKSAIIAASARGLGEGNFDAKSLLESIDSLIKQAREIKPIGRVAIKLYRDLEKLKKSPYNILLKDGDRLYIPSKPDFVMVTGEVLNPSTFVYDSSNPYSYIKKAGGLSENADEKIFIARANGFTEKLDLNSWFFERNFKVQQGDVIVVPIKIKTSSWGSVAKDLSSIVYQLAITVASLNAVGAF